jgi:hypothetical protein
VVVRELVLTLPLTLAAALFLGGIAEASCPGDVDSALQQKIDEQVQYCVEQAAAGDQYIPICYRRGIDNLFRYVRELEDQHCIYEARPGGGGGSNGDRMTDVDFSATWYVDGTKRSARASIYFVRPADRSPNEWRNR